MAVVTVFATSPSRQDRCGLCFRVAHFLSFCFLLTLPTYLPPSIPFGTFFPSSVLSITYVKVGKLKKYRYK